MSLFSDPNADPNGSGQWKVSDSTGEDTTHSLGGFQLGVGGNVSISIQREARRVVAQHRGHRFDIHAVLQGHRCEGVSQVMEAYAGYPSPKDDTQRITGANTGCLS